MKVVDIICALLDIFIRTWAFIARGPKGVFVSRSTLFSGRHLRGPKCLRFRTFIRASNRPSARLSDCLCRHRRHDVFEFSRVEGECDGPLYSPTSKSEQGKGSPELDCHLISQADVHHGPEFPICQSFSFKDLPRLRLAMSHSPLIFSEEY